jgi:DNA gyrase/topoisomerase IV subunit A
MPKSWQLLIVTEDGYAKRTPLREIRRTRRGGLGVQVTARGKNVAGSAVVLAEDKKAMGDKR